MSASPPPRGIRPPVLLAGLLLWSLVLAAGVWFLVGRGGPAEPRTTLVQADDTPLAAPPVVEGQPGADEPRDPLQDFAFTNQRGELVSKSDLLGEVWVADFIFTRCAATCPRVTESMRVLKKKLAGTGVKFVSFSVDPDYDDVGILNTYADMYGAAGDPDWHFLTGDKAELRRLITEDFGQPVWDNPRGEADLISHTNNFMLVGPGGVVRGKYNSLAPPEVAELRAAATDLARATCGERDAKGETP